MEHIIHETETFLPNGNILRISTIKTGERVTTRVIFNIYHIIWSGECDPKQEGYVLIFRNFYYRKKEYK